MSPDAPHSWVRRRRFLYIVNAFAALAVGWVVLNDMDSEVAETVVTMSFLLMSTSVGSYVFGAVWDDKSRKE